MGTPDFAVASLKSLCESSQKDQHFEIAAVVTAPDRPAGRGQKLKESPVKEFASAHNIPVLQPEKLKDEGFLNELASFNADLFVVVAFRMLPEVVWDMPSKGTINLHGSILPQYRGAAPINWAVINGEKKTGATTFFIEKEIDTGKIIDKIEIPIGPNDSAGKIHDDLMIAGAGLLTNTVNQILTTGVQAIDQSKLIGNEDIKHAPKIFKADCKINWKLNSEQLHNLIRGLSPYPTAWTELSNESSTKSMKIFSTVIKVDGNNNAGQIKTEADQVWFGTGDGWLEILELQLEGKKRMNTKDFVKGFNFDDYSLILE